MGSFRLFDVEDDEIITGTTCRLIERDDFDKEVENHFFADHESTSRAFLLHANPPSSTTTSTRYPYDSGDVALSDLAECSEHVTCTAYVLPTSSPRMDSSPIDTHAGSEISTSSMGEIKFPSSAVPIARMVISGKGGWIVTSVTDVFQPAAELVRRKVTALLNKLAWQNFHSISDQIVRWANGSNTQQEGNHDIVTRLILKAAVGVCEDEARWSEMYALLCWKIRGPRFDGQVKHDCAEGDDLGSDERGQLVRKCLINQCKEEFERCWASRGLSALERLGDEKSKHTADKVSGCLRSNHRGIL